MKLMDTTKITNLVAVSALVSFLVVAATRFADILFNLTDDLVFASVAVAAGSFIASVATGYIWENYTAFCCDSETENKAAVGAALSAVGIVVSSDTSLIAGGLLVLAGCAFALAHSQSTSPQS